MKKSILYKEKTNKMYLLILCGLLVSGAIVCSTNGDGNGNNGGGNGNGASPYVCPNGTTQSGTATEANVENCAACNSGFGLAAGGGGMICRLEFVCPNGTAVDNMPTEANVENCAGCDPGFRLTDGENDTQLCRRLALTNVANVDDSDDSSLELGDARSVTTAVVGDTTYLFVAGTTDDGVSVFSVGSDGALTNVDNEDDTSTLNLDDVRSVTTAVIGSTTYLFVAGRDDDGVSVFSVGSTGALTNVANEDDSDSVPAGVDGELELDGASSVTTAAIGDTTYLFVGGTVDSGVSVFSVGGNGALTNVANVDDSDDSSLELSGVVSVTTAVIGSTTYLFVTGFFDNGVSVFSVGSDDGALTNVDNVDDSSTNVPRAPGVTSELELTFATSVTTAVVGSTTYLFVAGLEDNGVSVFSVGSDGTLTNVDNEADDDTLNLSGSESVTTAVVGGTTYLFVAGSTDDGVSVFSVGSDGTLTNVANVEDDGDDGTLNLDGANSITTAVIGRSTYLFVAGQIDDGVSVFRLDLVSE